MGDSPVLGGSYSFAIQRQDDVWWGNCAWCSLGAAALLGGDGIRIYTTLGGEGEAVAIHIDGHQVRENLFVHFPIPMASAWNNVMFTCSTMLVFKDASAVDAWSRRHALPRGDVRAIQTVYEFARVWYGRHLEEDWRKWTISEAREIFRSFGLEGPIWDLPTVDRGF
ncbi:MAG: alkylmercury lyase family protein [Acidobacteriota bacterium]